MYRRNINEFKGFTGWRLYLDVVMNGNGEIERIGLQFCREASTFKEVFHGNPPEVTGHSRRSARVSLYAAQCRGGFVCQSGSVDIGRRCAVADGEQWVCFVPRNVKQRLVSTARNRYGAKNLQYRVFALFVYIALRPHLCNIERMVIDQDYEGPQAESTIKNLPLHLIRREKPDATGEFIRFSNVKGGAADRLAKRVFDGKERATYAMHFEELLQERTRGKESIAVIAHWSMNLPPNRGEGDNKARLSKSAASLRCR